jgi:hypothetical protein
MPRIRNVGEFDWQLLPYGANKDANFGWKLCLYFILDFDSEVWHAPGVYRDNDNPEEVAFNNKGVSLPTGAVPGLFSTLKLEEDTRVLPSRAREIARFFSLQEWSAGSIAAYYPGAWNRIRYSVGVKAFSAASSINYPTKFVTALAQKTNKWIRKVGLDRKNFLFGDPEVFQKGVVIGELRNTSPEDVERTVLHLRKQTGQKVEWAHTSNLAIQVFALGKVEMVRSELEKRLAR